MTKYSSKPSGLKQQTLIFSHNFWELAVSDCLMYSSKFLMRLQLRCWPELPSSESLIGAGVSVSKIAHSHGYDRRPQFLTGCWEQTLFLQHVYFSQHGCWLPPEWVIKRLRQKQQCILRSCIGSNLSSWWLYSISHTGKLNSMWKERTQIPENMALRLETIFEVSYHRESKKKEWRNKGTKEGRKAGRKDWREGGR